VTEGLHSAGSVRSNEAWLQELRGGGPLATAAQADLSALVREAVRKAVAGSGTVDEATLDDLVQVAVVHVLRHLGRFEGRSRFTTWAWSVAVRAALSELRKAAYRASGEALEAGQELTSTALPPHGGLERAEIVALMHRVIDRELSERQRTALLGELEGTPRPELQQRLGVNPNAYHKLLHDARQKLRTGLCEIGICDDEVREAFGL
jgi:RNA polymerase sigma factor (sigma-70 family)